MGERDTKKIQEMLDRVYSLHHKMEEKINQWEIWTDATSKLLYAIRKDVHQSITDVFGFCQDEYLHAMGPKLREIKTITQELKNIIDDEKYPGLPLSFFSSIVSSTMESLCEYLNYMPVVAHDVTIRSSKHIVELSPVVPDNKPSSSKPSSYETPVRPNLISSKEIVDTVNTELTELKKLLDCPSIDWTQLKKLLDDYSWEISPDNMYVFLKHDLYISFNKDEATAILNELTRLVSLDLFSLTPYGNAAKLWAIGFVNQLKNIFAMRDNNINKQKPHHPVVENPVDQPKKRKHRNPFKKRDIAVADKVSVKETQKIETPEIEAPIVQEKSIEKSSEMPLTSKMSEKKCAWKPDMQHLWYITDKLPKIWKNLLARLDILDEINEVDYQDVLDEYKEYIISQAEKLRIKTEIRTIANTYKSCSARTHETHRMGEMFVLIDIFLVQAKQQWEESERKHANETFRLKKEQEQKTFDQQRAYFPQLIQLLENFKKEFADSDGYKTQSAAIIKETFPEQFDCCVLQPFTILNAKLFSFSEEAMRGLWYLNRKNILSEDIKNVFKNASDQQILRGISQWWFFADIDDFINILKIHDMTKFVEKIQKTYTKI